MLSNRILITCILFNQFIFCMNRDEFLKQSPEAIVDQMSLDKKIGQLCIIAAVSDEPRNAKFMKTQPYKMDKETIVSLITKNNVGGIIFLGKELLPNKVYVYMNIKRLALIPSL